VRQDQTFADFFVSQMDELGWSNRVLAERAGVSFRAPADIRSGRLEKLLKSGDMSERKKRGVAQSTTRILKAFGVDPEPWLKKLGLPILKPVQLQPRSISSQVSHIAQKPVSDEDIESFIDARGPLGDLFTVELLIKMLINKHLKPE